MNQPQLFSLLSRPMTKTEILKAASMASNREYSVQDLLAFTCHVNSDVAYRASWILEQLILHEHEQIIPGLPDFLNRFPAQINPGCRRHLAKIMVLLMEHEMLKDLDKESIVEAAFDWLMNPDTPVSVKAHCLDLLFLLSKEIAWIAAELKIQTEFLMDEGSPAILSRGRKVLRLLRSR
jgi:hypothetical protein